MNDAPVKSPVTLETAGDVAIIRIDDGKANALGHVVLDAINGALDNATEARAVVIFGRDGKFSAGFDLAVMKDGPEASQAMVRKGAELCMRLYGAPVPILAGANGHALAAGAVVLMSCDVRVGTDSAGRVGLPETTIGMPLPIFAMELARDRLSRRHFTAATLLGTTYTQQEATDVGFLDRIVPVDELEATVMEQATALAENLTPEGFAATRVRARQATIDYVMETLDTDMASFEIATGD